MARINTILAMIILAVVILAAIDWRPDYDNPLFNDEEIGSLNHGGVIEDTHPKLVDADEVCLMGGFLDSDVRGCKTYGREGVALIRDGECTFYSVKGLESRVFAHHDYQCRPTSSGFRIVAIPAGDIEVLVFRENRLGDSGE